MKKVIASAGMLAIGAIGVQSASADASLAASDKPWSVSATLRGFYDDNYNTQPSGTPQHRSSWGLEVRPRADVNWSSGPSTVTASFIYDLRDYFSRPGNKLDQSFDLEFFGNHNFNERYSIDVEESFVDSQEPEVIDPNGSLPLRSNGDNLRNNASINFHAEVTPLLGFVLGYANTYYDYNGNTTGVTNAIAYSTSLNRIEQTVTLNSRWHVEEQTVAILGYQFMAVDYSSSAPIGTTAALVPIPSNSRDNYTHNVYVGVEHSFRSDLSLSLRAGAQFSDYYNTVPGTTNPDDISPFVDLSLTYAYHPDGTLTIGFRNSKNQTDVTSLGLGSTSIVVDEESSSVYASVTHKLTAISPKLSASLTGQYQFSDFNGGFGSQSDQFYLAGVNVAYQINRWLSTEVGYNYDRLESDVAGRSYDRNRIYFGFTGTY